MTQRGTRCYLLSAVAMFCCVVSNAATFNYTVSCNQTTLGPSTIDLGGLSNSGSVTLTPGVTSNNLSILNFGLANRVDNNTVTSGTFTGTQSCSLTFGGVTVNFSRSLNMTINPAGSGGCALTSFAGGCVTVGAVAVTVNLGVQGTVVITAGAATNLLAFDASLINGGIIIVPGLSIDSALLTLPGPAPTPVPPSVFLTLTGLAAAGLYQARRKLRLRRTS
jgi:hypothetical protein